MPATYINESALAWDPFDAIRPGLAPGEIAGFAVQLSSEDTVTTISKLVQRCIQSGQAVAADIVSCLYRWHEGYVGPLAEEPLRLLLAQLATEPAQTTRSERRRTARLAVDSAYVGATSVSRRGTGVRRKRT